MQRSVLVGTVLLALGLSAVGVAAAADVRDQAVLESVVKDLGIGLLGPEANTLKLPLTTGNWSLFGRVKPYASLGPRAFGLTEGPDGLAVPLRETDRFASGLGLGAGLSWQLTDQLQLFGEYQLLNMGGRGDGAAGRRELDTPGLSGGFSIRF